MGTPAPQRDEAVTALGAALRRLTETASDTSRDPRVAILDRLDELLPPARVGEVASFIDDFDPRVRDLAARVVAKLAPAATPTASRPRVRYPYQPRDLDLSRLPTSAVVEMEGVGTFELQLLATQAPITVARFAELVRRGYYNGLTFHRIAPNFVVQGGSPGANEYAGASRYMRDEVGPEPHTRGAVGISTRGRDTGDAQIFIDLVDNPRLDHEYTVFARVVSGMHVVDRFLEGARIVSVTLK